MSPSCSLGFTLGTFQSQPFKNVISNFRTLTSHFLYTFFTILKLQSVGTTLTSSTFLLLLIPLAHLALHFEYFSLTLCKNMSSNFWTLKSHSNACSYPQGRLNITLHLFLHHPLSSTFLPFTDPLVYPFVLSPFTLLFIFITHVFQC